MNANEIDLAAKVHYSFIPENYANDFLEIAVTLQPKGVIGGDYCSILPADENRLFVAMCDVTGHNVASALYASRINSFVFAHALKYERPCEAINALNKFLCERLAEIQMYASFCALFFDSEKRTMQYAGAAHPPVLHFRSTTSQAELLKSETTFLGFQDPLPVPCSTEQIQLNSGDKVILYSDGLIEVKNPKGEFYGTEGLQEFTHKNHALGPHDFNRKLLETVSGGGQNIIRDDILLITIVIK